MKESDRGRSLVPDCFYFMRGFVFCMRFTVVLCVFCSDVLLSPITSISDQELIQSVADSAHCGQDSNSNSIDPCTGK